MPVSRRDFLRGAAASAAAWPLIVRAEIDSPAQRVFRHGVASGDPLTDRVVLWTRATPPTSAGTPSPIEVRWQIATDERMADVVDKGTAQALSEHDFTVKVDAANLRPGRPYFYAFEAAGERSPVGRTRTLPPSGVDRIRLASVSCSNYPAGYFNVYRCLANRTDLDAILHLGDYIYEFANGRYGDGSDSGRLPLPAGEAVTLLDYRLRYATYRSDIDLQEAHRLHPFIVVWDDHESANDAWSGGAENHGPKDGDWHVRMAAAYRAYTEWLPVRETGSGFHLYRGFQFGGLADLLMLDTRSFRDKQASPKDVTTLMDARRTMLGAEQESWLFEELRQSQRAGTAWRLLGQQVLFSPISPPGFPAFNTDVWDGYPAARERVFDFLAREKIRDVTVLTGDLHSSWALDVPRAWKGYDARTGSGSLAVELVTPAISSPPFFADKVLKERASIIKAAAPHLKYLDGENRGYVLLEITRDRLQADCYVVPSVTVRSAAESKTKSFVCERGSSHLAST